VGIFPKQPRLIEKLLEEFGPIDVEVVQGPEQRLLFRELVSRHHYLASIQK
jgi:hypothetical protein